MGTVIDGFSHFLPSHSQGMSGGGGDAGVARQKMGKRKTRTW